jgi:hypothetical protein
VSLDDFFKAEPDRRVPEPIKPHQRNAIVVPREVPLTIEAVESDIRSFFFDSGSYPGETGQTGLGRFYNSSSDDEIESGDADEPHMVTLAEEVGESQTIQEIDAFFAGNEADSIENENIRSAKRKRTKSGGGKRQETSESVPVVPQPKPGFRLPIRLQRALEAEATGSQKKGHRRHHHSDA